MHEIEITWTCVDCGRSIKYKYAAHVLLDDDGEVVYTLDVGNIYHSHDDGTIHRMDGCQFKPLLSSEGFVGVKQIIKDMESKTDD